VLVANFPNADMVGHTGVYAAGVRGIEAVDAALAKVRKVVQEERGVLLITADHGNVEEMGGDEVVGILTQHSCNPVPLIIADYRSNAQPYELKHHGTLGDIAPTILDVLHVPQPKEMTGKSLLKTNN